MAPNSWKRIEKYRDFFVPPFRCVCERMLLLFAVRSPIFNSHFMDFDEGVLSWSRANKCPLAFGRNGMIKNEHFFSWLLVSTSSISRCVAFSSFGACVVRLFLLLQFFFVVHISNARACAFRFHSLFSFSIHLGVSVQCTVKIRKTFRILQSMQSPPKRRKHKEKTALIIEKCTWKQRVPHNRMCVPLY